VVGHRLLIGRVGWWKETMDPRAILRRIVHLSTPLFLVYFLLLPSPLWPGGPSREVGLLLALVATLAFETRPPVAEQSWCRGCGRTKAEQISAAAWAGIALSISFLFFPIEFTAPRDLRHGPGRPGDQRGAPDQVVPLAPVHPFIWRSCSRCSPCWSPGPEMGHRCRRWHRPRPSPQRG
jgi:hypothetical protein